jgi:hypothetical protein
MHPYVCVSVLLEIPIYVIISYKSGNICLTNDLKNHFVKWNINLHLVVDLQPAALRAQKHIPQPKNITLICTVQYR